MERDQFLIKKGEIENFGEGKVHNLYMLKNVKKHRLLCYGLDVKQNYLFYFLMYY